MILQGSLPRIAPSANFTGCAPSGDPPPSRRGGYDLRQGEVFGLRRSEIDVPRRRILVRQQVKYERGRPVFGPPKGRRTREVPLPEFVSSTLAARPFRQGADDLLFVTREGGPLTRTYYNTHVWKPALRCAGVEPTRENGMHALRHFYASVQLEAGTSIRALAEYLGHADPASPSVSTHT